MSSRPPRMLMIIGSIVLIPTATIAQSEWLEFNAGANENSSPLIQYNDDWDDFLTFDVEVRGLLADTTEVDSVKYLRFDRSPDLAVADSVGCPELPIARCFVWVPDSTDLSVSYTANCLQTRGSLPVYPAPLDSLREDSTSTPYIDEFFRKDSSAYSSDEWYPDTLVRLIDTFHLRDTRVAIVDVYPMQYLADDDSIRVFSDIEIRLDFEDTTAIWSTADLGPYEDLIGDRLLGYDPEDNPWAPLPGMVYRPEDLEEGPARVPDYVILTADGLDGWWIDTLAHHRANLNGFDVAIVCTDDVLSEFGQGAHYIDTDIIRDFTETMWEWNQPASKRPFYLLLIGDHEDSDSAGCDWFLPTEVFEYSDWTGINSIGDDDWFVYFGESHSNHLAFPDMVVGRLPVRETSNLRNMIDAIRAFEAASAIPAPDSLDWRRYLTQLLEESGRSWAEGGHAPDSAWTDSVSRWCGYDWDYVYCGDCNEQTTGDGSTMTSIEWDDTLDSLFTRGQQIVMYINHGIPHVYSAGMDFSDTTFAFQGLPDSSFGCFDVDSLGGGQIAAHGYPLIINACCATGRFNHTAEEHDAEPEEERWYYCQNPDSAYGPVYSYPVNCLGEQFIQNTESGAIGFFAATSFTYGDGYNSMCVDIIEAVLAEGVTRTGDAIARMRISDPQLRFRSYNLPLYNLLGDPAVDLGDRVKFRSCCDLIIAPSDLDMARYPTRPVSGGVATSNISVTMRNAGAVSSDSFEVELEIDIDAIHYDTTLTEVCSGLSAGTDTTITFDGWVVPANIKGRRMELTATADPDQDCDDSWTSNNSATRVFTLLDLYPNDSGWPVRLPGSIKSPPALADLDGDDDLEIIAVVGGSYITAIDVSDPSAPLWESDVFYINPIGNNPGYSIPAVEDITGDGDPEVVVDTQDSLVVLDGSDGDLLCSFEHDQLGVEWSVSPHSVVISDVFRETGGALPRDEVSFVAGDMLYILRYESGDMVKRDSLRVVLGGEENRFSWVSSAELDGNDGDDLIVTVQKNASGIHSCLLGLYSSDNPGSFYDSRTWSGQLNAITAIGELAGSDMIAMSRKTTDSGDPNPADIIDPSDLGAEANCITNSNLASYHVLCCMMADWSAIIPGLDMVIAPAENQCFVWDEDGDEIWFDRYGNQTGGRPPFGALGDLDDDGTDDLVVGTREGKVFGYDFEGDELRDLGFPYTLPSEVYGGFVIADIDNDGEIEMVFGTMDDYLHCWELGDCDSLYTPWPQCQHDPMRTGVLE